MPFGQYKDFKDCVAENQDKSNPEAYCAAIEKKITGKWPGENKLNRLHEKICKEKYLGSDEVPYNLEGKKIIKTRTIKLYRPEWNQEIIHDLYSDGKIKIATNGIRPNGGKCNDRICPIHKISNNEYSYFKPSMNGFEFIDEKGIKRRGDKYKCVVGGEEYIEL